MNKDLKESIIYYYDKRFKTFMFESNLCNEFNILIFSTLDEVNNYLSINDVKVFITSIHSASHFEEINLLLDEIHDRNIKIITLSENADYIQNENNWRKIFGIFNPDNNQSILKHLIYSAINQYSNDQVILVKNKESNNLLHSENEKILFNTFAEYIEDVYFAVDNNYFIKYISPSISKFGYNNEKTISQNFCSFIIDKEQDNLQKSVSKFITKQEPLSEIFSFITANSKITPVEISFIKIQVSLNGYILYGIIRNISKYKLNEDVLLSELSNAKESEKAKNQFLANISHELRNSLNSIIGFLSILSNTELPDPSQQSYIKYLNSSSDQMLRVINGIINISMIESGQIKLNNDKVMLFSIIKSLHTTFETEVFSKELQFILDLPTTDIEIVTDKEKVIQIINNIVCNSLKFTQKGHIKIGLKVLPDEILFYVEDTGSGIHNEKLKELKTFLTEKSFNNEIYTETIGLGLKIAKSYTELLHGSLSVESSINKGSIFTLKLPYQIDKKEKEKNNNTHKDIHAINWSEKVILIAEDEPINFYYLEQVLAKTRAKIIRATNGKEAIDQFVINSKIDIILMDIKMPVLDGIEATKVIKAQNPNIPIVAQTAHALTSDRDKVIAAGCDYYLKKPIKRDDLLTLLSTILD
ncbi:MAG: response regulator [Bacteroidales bacterium]|nr:response regulator [Bacteroidales bacterium]